MKYIKTFESFDFNNTKNNFTYITKFMSQMYLNTILTEAIDKINNNHIRIIYTKIDDDIKIIKNCWRIDFQINYTYNNPKIKKHNFKDYHNILDFVFNDINDFMIKFNPNAIYIQPNSTKKFNIYKHIISQHINNDNYKIEYNIHTDNAFGMNNILIYKNNLKNKLNNLKNSIVNITAKILSE